MLLVKYPLHLSGGGVARKCQAGFIGIASIARKFFSGIYVIKKYIQSDSTDTTISSQTVQGESNGTLNISLKTVRGGGTSDSYNGVAAGVLIYAPDNGWESQKLTFTLSITGSVEYYAKVTIGFWGSSGSIREYDLISGGNKSYTIPTGTNRILLNIWCRYERNCTAKFTNVTINGEVVDLTV